MSIKICVTAGLVLFNGFVAYRLVPVTADVIGWRHFKWAVVTSTLAILNAVCCGINLRHLIELLAFPK